MADQKTQTGMVRHEEPTRAVALGREGVMLRSMDDLKSFAVMACNAGMFPHFAKPEALALAVIWGQEIGINPIQALNHIAIIKGRPVLWGPVPMAIVMRSGVLDIKRHKEYVVGKPGSADFAAVVETARIGGPVTRVIFSWDDAKRAGLAGKDTYTAYGADMLLNRARSRALKRVFPDVLMGCGVATVAGNNAATEADIVEDDGPARVSSLSDLPAIDGEVVSNWGDSEPKREALTPEVEPSKAARLSDPFSDEEIAAALIRFVEIVAKENGDTIAVTAPAVLAFERGGVKGHINGPGWFTEHEGKDAAKHAARVDIAREIADRLLGAQDQAFPLCEKAGTP